MKLPVTRNHNKEDEIMMNVPLNTNVDFKETTNEAVRLSLKSSHSEKR